MGRSHGQAEGQRVSGNPPFTLADKIALWERTTARTLDGFAEYCRTFLRVRTLARLKGQRRRKWQWVPFELNDAQRRLVAEILAELDAGRSALIIVLKCRKLGISTVVQALGYWFGSIEEGWHTQVVAHDAQATATIASIARGFADHLPAVVAPRLGATPLGAGLRWSNGSKLQVFTQRSDNAARGSSPSLLHISELAFWGHGRAKTTEEDALTSLMAALEEGNDVDDDPDEWLDGIDDIEEADGDELEADAIAAKREAEEIERRHSGATGGTVTVIESTANGAQGAYYARWLASQQPGSPWKGLFFPWQSARKYQFPEATKEDRDANDRACAALVAGDLATAREVFVSLGFEPWLCDRAVRFAYSVAQCRFFVRLLAKFGGDLAKADQEFPSAPDLAFAASGRRVWSDTDVDAHPVRKPVFVSGPLGPLPKHGTPEERLRAAATPGDCIRIWEWPNAAWSDRYAAGSDVSAGVGGDSTTGVFVDRVTSRQVAEFCSNAIPPDLAAVQLARLGEAYGWALICWEANNHGNVLGSQLTGALAYPNLWRRVVAIGAPTPDPSAWIRNFGYLTNEGSRTALANRVITALRTRALAVVSDRVTAEMRTWVFSAEGRPDHVPGRHDDLLIGTALALYAGDQMASPKDTTPILRDPDRWDDEQEEKQSAWAH